MDDFPDRVAIVTGGAQGLGQALCHRLAHDGAIVVVADINERAATVTAAQIADLTRMRAALSTLVKKCHGSGSKIGCPILEALQGSDQE